MVDRISRLSDVHWEEFRNVLERKALQRHKIADSVKLLSDKLAEKLAESADKSAESARTKEEKLSKRHRQILNHMKTGELYSTEDIAATIQLKGPRTRQLLNELVAKGLIECTAATKNRRYIKRNNN